MVEAGRSGVAAALAFPGAGTPLAAGDAACPTKRHIVTTTTPQALRRISLLPMPAPPCSLLDGLPPGFLVPKARVSRRRGTACKAGDRSHAAARPNPGPSGLGTRHALASRQPLLAPPYDRAARQWSYSRVASEPCSAGDIVKGAGRLQLRLRHIAICLSLSIWQALRWRRRRSFRAGSPNRG